MGMYDIYVPCEDEYPSPVTTIQSITNQYEALQSVTLSVVNVLSEQVNNNTRNINRIASIVTTIVKRRLKRDTEALGSLIILVQSQIATANTESKAILYQIAAELQRLEEADQSESGETISAVEAQQSGEQAGASTETGTTTAVVPSHIMPPIPFDPCNPPGLTDLVNATAQWALESVFPDSDGNLHVDQDGLTAQLTAFGQAFALCPLPEKPPPRAPREHPQKVAEALPHGTKPATTLDVPIDLDQPLAFRFAPDDSAWQSNAESFVGGWLSNWDNAPSIASLFQQRDQIQPPQSTDNGEPF
jgi:hypothetical protein